MDKSMYSDDIIWYDQSIKSAIEALDRKYPNAIPIFGGALGAAKYVNCEHPDFSKFVKCIANAIRSAKFFGWHEDASGVMRRFCHLCYVDPNIVAVYLELEESL